MVRTFYPVYCSFGKSAVKRVALCFQNNESRTRRAKTEEILGCSEGEVGVSGGSQGRQTLSVCVLSTGQAAEFG